MIDDLLGDGPAYHDTQSERLAGELEKAAREPIEPRHWVQFLHWSNHTIGEHLSDWPRARTLAERVLAGRQPEDSTAAAWGKLSVARFMEGDRAGAAEAEKVYVSGAVENSRAALIDTKMTLANAMIGSKRMSEGAALYAETLVLARGGPPSGADRTVAVASNNLASELLEATARSPAQDQLMRAAADAAHEFWLRCGNWQNEERALYLRALVANALDEPAVARDLVDEALKVIAANGSAPIDETFLRLARANALAMLGDADGHRRDLVVAENAAQAWDDEGLKNWFAEERAKIRML